MDNQKLIGVSEAANLACVSRQTIQTWIKTGKLAIVGRGRPEGYKGQPKVLLDPHAVMAVARKRGTIGGPETMRTV